MRTNRTTRIGIVLIGIGVLVGLAWLIGAALFSRDTPTVATGGGPADDGLTEINTSVRGMQVVALEPIPGKSILTSDMLTVREAPADAPTDDYVTDLDAVLGYVTREQVINPGDPIRKDQLLGHITKVGVSGLVRLGERAMVIPLDQPTLHDLIKAGDYVDVVAAFEGQEANTIVRGVRVLAVDVFAKEYPDVSIAMRSPYKHPPANADLNAVPTPMPTADPNAPPGAQPAPAPASQAPEVADDAPPPASALTLEVTPEEATRISLAQAANARIDFILIPHEEIVFPGEGPRLVDGPDGVGPDGAGPVEIATATIETVASTILPEVAPYSARLKRQASAAGQPSGGQTTGGTGGTVSPPSPPRETVLVRRPEPTYEDDPPIPPITMGEIPRAEPPTPTPLPETYQVKIIPDGKEVRYETVLKPKN